MSVALIVGDNRWTLQRLPDASVDAVVCDPPYGLAKEPDMAEVLAHWLAGDDYEATGGGFMGKSWDSFVPGPATWREVHRVLKPGGHVLAFAGARTVDLMGLALRLGGFEIRDCLSWLYGSGFPKSLDVSKAIDKAAGAKREVIGREANWGAAKAEDGKVAFGDYAGGWDVTAPCVAEAVTWQGWGTALKPAWEPIIVARKPLQGTVAANVLAHGTGAINVDGCRVGDGEGVVTFGRVRGDRDREQYHTGTVTGVQPSGQGRWPANVILDDTAGAMLDEQTGTLKSGSRAAGPHELMGYMGADVVDMPEVVGDSGGASRFFYCAKPSKAERSAGLEPGANVHPTVKPVALMRWLVRLVTPPGGLVLDPFLGSGTTGVAAVAEGFRFVGLERERPYMEIAEGRIGHAATEAGCAVRVLDFTATDDAA